MTVTKSLKKPLHISIISVLLCVIILLLCGCSTPKKQSDNDSSKISSSVEKKKGTVYSVVYGTFNNAESIDSQSGAPAVIGFVKSNKYITTIAEELKNEDVYYQITAAYYFKSNNDKTKAIEEKISFLSSLNPIDIKYTSTKPDSYGAWNCQLIVDYDALSAIVAPKDCSVYIATHPRPENYSQKIYDYVAHCTEKHDETEVIVVTNGDFQYRYATNQGILARHTEYHSFSLADYERYDHLKNAGKEANEKYVAAIWERNGIDKNKITINVELGNGVSGFNAKLTKNEILKLAEDEDVRAIIPTVNYAIETVTVYE